jgi:hypothetical protein
MAGRNSKFKGDHIALYGNVRMNRGYCSICETNAFVIDGKLQCCDKRYEHVPKSYVRICEPENVRRQPSEAAKRYILNEQEHCCIYCSRSFGNYTPKIAFQKSSKQYLLKAQWDHLVPFSYNQDNRAENFVAACQLCNAWKSALMFQSLDEARIYLLNKWESALIKVYDDEESYQISEV